MPALGLVRGGVCALLFAAAVSCSKNKCDDVVLTPGGPAPRACVHEVPNGGSVAMDDAGAWIVTVDGGVVARYPPCECDASTQARQP